MNEIILNAEMLDILDKHDGLKTAILLILKDQLDSYTVLSLKILLKILSY